MKCPWLRSVDMTISDLMAETGLSREEVLDGVREVSEKGLIDIIPINATRDGEPLLRCSLSWRYRDIKAKETTIGEEA